MNEKQRVTVIKKKSLQKRMKKNLRIFRREAKRCKKEGKEGSDWLLDNFYLLQSETEEALAQCRTMPKLFADENGLPVLYHICNELCERSILPTGAQLTAFFAQRGISGKEAEALPNLLRCVLLQNAVRGCTETGEEALRRLGNAVRSLRKLGEISMEEIVCAGSGAHRILLQDPDGWYGAMDEESQAIYRRKLSLAAEKRGMEEEALAQECLQKAKSGKTPYERHVGTYFAKPEYPKGKGTALLITEALLPLFTAITAGVFARLWYLPLLLWLPLWEILRPILDRFALESNPPAFFYRLKADDKRVRETRTVIALSTLLPSAENSEQLAKKLRRIYRSNGAENIKVCCLADFKNAKTPVCPEDDAALAATKRVIDALNKEYGGGFLLALRPRTYSPTQGEFSGRFRKRGAITQLVRLIKGQKSNFKVIYGDTEGLRLTKYILALDYDTGTPFQTATRLVQTALHPFNAPRYNLSGTQVVGGYGILAPCIRPKLLGRNSTPFQRLLAGSGGISVYDSLNGEKYQDLFGDSIFTGKGLIDVDAYYTVLDKAFPGETVLSHDILEGCSLRTGYVSDAQMTDGFPASQLSWCRRYDRWIRGDWQNISHIFKKSKLNGLSRFKLADNLRRSLVPVAAIAGLIVSLFLQEPIGGALAAAALFCMGASEFYGFVSSLCNGGFGLFSRLYFSHTLPAALQALVRGFLNMMMTAETAFYSLYAILRACFRMLFSKKNLLEWTTAAQSERQGEFGRKAANCLPSLVLGVLLIWLGGSVARLGGMLILADIPFALCSCIKSPKKASDSLSGEDRERLQSYMAAMWRYFEENCNKANHFLPPDNIQESPVGSVARRTSPTNIGLMLLCTLTARDFHFISSQQLCERLCNSLNSIEKLQKYHGNLLNWYSTATLAPLNPVFVSTVDSGNYLCCLTALRQGLWEYVPECEELRNVIARITALLEATDLRPLYDEKRNLFSLGVNAKGEKSENDYDLFMSEARMTAYYAVARRQVPQKHWGALGRILVGDGRYTGLVSWTGTMFEYFMPYLFLPAPEGSLSYESLRFCLWCQKRRVFHGVWGISESGFYAFDGHLNYQYKAHGVQKLGLKRGLHSERVVAPYASFLTLSMAPGASLRNLKRLQAMGMTGKYGFYEAVDFTAGRCPDGEYAVVSSYMAHHIGMSMVAVANLLCDNVMQKRFMRDNAMAGAQSLLNEHIPNGARVFRDIPHRPVPKVHERTERKIFAVENPNPLYPAVHLYANGGWTLCITDSGAGVSRYDGINMTVQSEDILCRPQGVFGVFREKERVTPFVSCLNRDSKIAYQAKFGERECFFWAKTEGLNLQMQVAVLRGKPCEMRTFCVENTGKTVTEGDLLLYLEPCLAEKAGYAAHPAFSKLFLTAEKDGENGILTFSRRTREGESPVALSVGLKENIACTWETDRRGILQSGMGIFTLLQQDNAAEKHLLQTATDACAFGCVHIRLRPREKAEYTLFLCGGSNGEDTKNLLFTLRSQKRNREGARDPFCRNVLDSVLSQKLLPAVFYPYYGILRSNPVEKMPAFSKEELWSFGISGDVPIILCYIEEEKDIETVKPYIRINKTLRSCCIKTDVVVAFREEEGYATPLVNCVQNALREADCEMIFGVLGGVHAVNLSGHSPAQWAALKYAAAFDASLVDKEKKENFEKFFPREIINNSKKENKDKFVKQLDFTDGQITIAENTKNRYVPWCLTLCNPSFGTMVSDKSLGFTWALNSHENKLSPWWNDPCSDNQGELLILQQNGKMQNVLMGATAHFTPEKARWENETAHLRFAVSVTVPERGTVKRIRVTVTNEGTEQTDFSLAYYWEPVLGNTREELSYFTVKKTEKGGLVQNAFGRIYGFGALQSDSQVQDVCFDKNNFFAGKWQKSGSSSVKNPCVAVIRREKLSPKHSMTLEYSLSFGKTEKAALYVAEKAPLVPASPRGISIQSGNGEKDLFCNVFLYGQIRNSRFWGRTGFYQNGGAYGFRDQLQDSLAFLYSEPNLTRTHIIRCCHAQFPQGDVLHWWHCIANKSLKMTGVRTRCSDDRLWLPYVLCRYCEVTGDDGILQIPVHYIDGRELESGETECCMEVSVSEKKDTVLYHALKAVEISLALGKNGLPLIGSGDWNDGFNRMGIQGRGESVWLGMFLIIVLERFSSLLQQTEKKQTAARYGKIAEELRSRIVQCAFDGEIFLRAVTDDGMKIGCADSPCCKIDLLPQAFATFAKIGTKEQREGALRKAAKELIDTRSRTVALLKPGFAHRFTDTIGYIAAYPEGIRENGGQYTHAAVWLAAACYEEGLLDLGDKITELLIPPNCNEDREKLQYYRGESYILAGDVCTDTPVGTAGWTHYTGAAAWYYLTELTKEKRIDGDKKFRFF